MVFDVSTIRIVLEKGRDLNALVYTFNDVLRVLSVILYCYDLSQLFFAVHGLFKRYSNPGEQVMYLCLSSKKCSFFSTFINGYDIMLICQIPSQ